MTHEVIVVSSLAMAMQVCLEWGYLEANLCTMDMNMACHGKSSAEATMSINMLEISEVSRFSECIVRSAFIHASVY